jgi:hypothetical protein
MSADRDELEAAQARIKELEGTTVSDEQLTMLASMLEKEAELFERTMESGERRALARDTTGQSTKQVTFTFAAVILTPMVSMIGFSLSKGLRLQQELAVLIIILGAVLIAATLLARARRSIAHFVSAEWRIIAKARRMAESLRSL